MSNHFQKLIVTNLLNLARYTKPIFDYYKMPRKFKEKIEIKIISISKMLIILYITMAKLLKIIYLNCFKIEILLMNLLFIYKVL